MPWGDGQTGARIAQLLAHAAAGRRRAREDQQLLTPCQRSDSTLLILGAGGHGPSSPMPSRRRAAGPGCGCTDRDPARWARVNCCPAGRCCRWRRRCACGAVPRGDRRGRTASGRPPRSGPWPACCPSARGHRDARRDRGRLFRRRAGRGGTGARLARGVIVNHGAVVDHDAQVGDFSARRSAGRAGRAVQHGRRACWWAPARACCRRCGVR